MDSAVELSTGALGGVVSYRIPITSAQSSQIIVKVNSVTAAPGYAAINIIDNIAGVPLCGATLTSSGAAVFNVSFSSGMHSTNISVEVYCGIWSHLAKLCKHPHGHYLNLTKGPLVQRESNFKPKENNSMQYFEQVKEMLFQYKHL